MYILAGRPLFSQIPFITFMFIHIYGLWVVNSFVEELRDINRQQDLKDMKAKQKERVKEDLERDGIAKIQQSREQMMHFNDGFENEKSWSTT